MQELEAPIQSSGRSLNFILVLFLAINIAFPLLLRIYGSQMYPFFIILYVWFGVYVAFLGVLLRREHMENLPLVPSKFTFIVLAIFTLAPRLVFLGLDEYISLDPLWYLDFGKLMTRGAIPYRDFYFPYPPIFSYVIFLFMFIYPSVDIFRIFSSVLDVIIAYLIWNIARTRFNQKWALTTAFAYALLPLSIIESGWNGHFEPLVTFFILVAILMLLRDRYRLSGIFLALGVVTKIYPIVLIPIGLIYCKTWKHRIEFLFSGIICGIISTLPIVLMSIFVPVTPSGTGYSGSSSSSIDTILLSFLGIQNNGTLVSLFVVIMIFIGLFLSLYVLIRNDEHTHGVAYYWASLGLGSLLFIVGLLAAFYPLLPASRVVYWRYPIDVGIIRGTTSASVGIYIIWRTVLNKRKKVQEYYSRENVALLLAGLLLLLLAFSRGVFYGWYLLWSIPFFFLLRNRRLGITIIVCLLLIYPSYTHDNFESLGIDEQRNWSQTFENIEQWDVNIIQNNQSIITAGVEHSNSSGIFWFDTNSTDSNALQNTSIIFHHDVNVEFTPNLEFVARISSNWDPTFGAKALLSIQYQGLNSSNHYVNGTLIYPTTLFTNLTRVLWRTSLEYVITPSDTVEVHNISVIILPLIQGNGNYKID
ncbi:MAG: glycosyltransferase 87 family protein, partial [Candidatus Thorarchaeota archaeon]